MTAGNLALAATLAKNNIAGAEAGTWALRTYLEMLKPGAALGDKELIARVNEIEGVIPTARRQANTSESGEVEITIGGRTVTVSKGDSIHAIRDDIVKALILDAQGK
jgi:hypothetical protein